MKIKLIFTILIISFIFQSCEANKKLNTFSSNDEIYSSIDSENLKIFKKLLKKYNINALDKNGRTFLMEAVLLNINIDIAQYLVSENADINAQDKDGNTALVLALENESYEIVSVLLEKGKDINVNLKPKDKRPFLFACKTGDLDNIKLLVEKGIDYKKVDNEGTNALMIAISYEKGMDLVEYLIDIGIDINARDNYGETALMMCTHSNVKMNYLDLLIKKGADLNIVNKENKTALDIALEYENKNAVYNNSSVIHMLKNAGAKRAKDLK